MENLLLGRAKMYHREANVAPVGVASSTLAGLLYWWTKIMSKDNAARRNRALRKIRKAEHIDPEIKIAVEVVLDLLSPQSGYNVARPSAATIAKRLRRSRRSGQWYVKIIKQLGIFRCIQLSPEQARAFCEQHFGFRPKLDKCVTFAPNLFIVDPQHPLWDKATSLPKAVDHEMGEIVQQVKAERNSKTTSRLASNAAKHPKHVRQQTRNSKYCLYTTRLRLRKTCEALRDDDANDDILRQEETERWYREALLDDVANVATVDVASDAQVL
jgi:hypothetical protein